MFDSAGITSAASVGHELTNVIGVPGGVAGHCECGWWSHALPDADAVRFVHSTLHLPAAQPRLFSVR